MLDTNVTILGLLIFTIPLVIAIGFIFWDLYASLRKKEGLLELRSTIEVAKSENKLSMQLIKCIGMIHALQREVEDLKRNKKETK